MVEPATGTSGRGDQDLEDKEKRPVLQAIMAMSTPHRRSLGRPRQSLGLSAANTASSPNLSASFASSQRPSASTRKPSGLSTISDYHSETYDHRSTDNSSSPMTTSRALEMTNRNISGDDVGNKELDIGDAVDVPGGMHGIVRFIGEVKGKQGIFAGVELNKEWAARGKNNGDVEGVRYFTTSIPGAGIFLPSSKAYRRLFPVRSSDSFPPTPTSPSLAAFNLGGRGDKNADTTPTPAASKLSHAIGQTRAASPVLKPRSRPSLPRPESPLRRTQNANTATPSGRPSLGAPKFSKGGPATPRYAPSPTPGKFGSNIGPGRTGTGDPGKRPNKALTAVSRTPAHARPASRNLSRPDSRFDNDFEDAPVGMLKTTNRSRPPSQDDEIQRLRSRLAERDKQLKDQASSLLEMEASVTELHSLLPSSSPRRPTHLSRNPSVVDDADASQLRMLLREKNEKIAALTAEFDSHRADFRSTIDTLELASTETEKIYEKKVEDLSLEVQELQEQAENMDSVTHQFKQLEDLVQELEEGLEDARRGEAEARGEVEFLRGEVERGRSELKRERERAAATLSSPPNSQRSSREVEQRDDEIRGLKAIIHSLSRDADIGSPKTGGSRRVSKQRHSGQANGHPTEEQLAEERKAREKLEREVKDLENLVDAKTYREEELENELKRLKTAAKHASADSATSPTRNSNLSRVDSNEWRGYHSPAAETHAPPQPQTLQDADSHSEASNLWCEICEAPGHDILTCTNMFGSQAEAQKASPGSQRTGRDVVAEGLKGLNGTTSLGLNNTSALGLKSAASSPWGNGAGQVKPLSPSAKRNVGVVRIDAAGMVPGKASGVVDASRWCALCERDGHESVDCPEEEVEY